MARSTSTPLQHHNDKDLPIFECGRKKKYIYMVRKAVHILLSEHQQGIKCSKTPLNVRQNKSFLVNDAKLKNWQDIKSVMNDVYCRMLHICTSTVEVSMENDVDNLDKKNQLGEQQSIPHLHQFYAQ